MTKKLKITKSSGNVFKDLGLKNPEKLLKEANKKIEINIVKLKKEKADFAKASRLTFGEFKPLKGTDDFVASLKIDSVQDILAMAGKQKFTVDELLYQLPANPKGKIKDIILAALTLRAIKNSVKSSKKVK